jgi:energy-coupling factor transport system substrate-specific component
MRELISCWQNTRMLVLIALCSALYVAVLIPFKLAVIVPGITEIRPGAALPVVFSVFFGPAAAWGAGFGNIIGDFLGGTIGPGSVFGFFGNLLYGYIPYRVIRMLKSAEEGQFSRKGWIALVSGIFLASGLCASVIALGVDWLKIVDFSFLANAIFINNLGVSLLLAPLLIKALEKRVRQMRLSYDQVLEPGQISRPPIKHAGLLMVVLLMLAIYTLMMAPSLMQLLPLASQHPGGFRIGAAALLTILALLLV